MRILSASYFSKFFGGKIKNFEQGFGEQKMTKNKLTRLQNKNQIRFNVKNRLTCEEVQETLHWNNVDNS